MSDDVGNPRITLVLTQSGHRGHAGHTTLTARRTLSIHAPAMPPSARLPIEFRPLSLHLGHTKKSDHSSNGSKSAVKGQLAHPIPLLSHRSTAKRLLRFVLLDLSKLNWHKVSIDEAPRRLALAQKTGLEAAQARAARLSSARIGSRPRQAGLYAGWLSAGYLAALAALCWPPASSLPTPGTASHIFLSTPSFFWGL